MIRIRCPATPPEEVALEQGLGVLPEEVEAADKQTHPAFFCCLALTFAHRARCAAAIFRRAAADSVRLGLAVGASVPKVLLAHRAFCARLIFLRTAADNVRRFLAGPALRPARAASAAFKPLTSSCTRSRSFFNCWTIPDRFAISSPRRKIVSAYGRDFLLAEY